MKNKKLKKLKKPDFVVELYPDERKVLKDAYLRFIEGRVDDTNLLDLYPPEILGSLVDKGLMEVEKPGKEGGLNRWFISSDGVWLARILVSEKTPFENAFIKPGGPPEQN
jgi:hypothetical protein